MVTGQRAFTGKSQASVIAAILQGDPQPISALQPMTPAGLDRVVKTCLAKDPDERWQSAHDLMRELRSVAEGGSDAASAGAPAARRGPRSDEWRRPSRRFSLLAGGARGYWLGHSPPEPARVSCA